MEEFRAIVSGRVQMVTYRTFIHKHAQHLALTGFVRNLPNGTVEIVAQGYEDNLKKLLEYARKGPFMAQVANIEVSWREPTREYGKFEITY